jgi:hypothetical protein
MMMPAVQEVTEHVTFLALPGPLFLLAAVQCMGMLCRYVLTAIHQNE